MEEDPSIKAGLNHFILSAIVFIDKDTKYSKRFAFIDFNCKEAADLCVEAWHNNNMKSYPNRLIVTKFDADYIKLTKKER